MRFSRETGVFFFVGIALLLVTRCFAGPRDEENWESTLKEAFDVVESFDGLADWTGTGYGDVARQEDMPRRTDGKPSIWEYYSFWGGQRQGPWIGTREPGKSWSGAKSLIIDYVYPSSGFDSGYGPSRLGFHVGAAPSDGYQREVYVFSMQKYSKRFFPHNGDSIYYLNFLKTLDISTGFRDITHWGTQAEQESTDGSPQVVYQYGLNFAILNIYSGDSTLGRARGHYNVFKARPDGLNIKTEREAIAWGADYNEFIVANSGDGAWFGIEYHYVKSEPAGTPNGLLEIWVYDTQGTVRGYDKQENLITFANGPTPLNHAINKFVFGGNRGYVEFKKGVNNCTESHVYIDDIIVHKERIGPSYFGFVNGKPTAPSNPRLF